MQIYLNWNLRAYVIKASMLALKFHCGGDTLGPMNSCKYYKQQWAKSIRMLLLLHELRKQNGKMELIYQVVLP